MQQVASELLKVARELVGADMNLRKFKRDLKSDGIVYQDKGDEVRVYYDDNNELVDFDGKGRRGYDDFQKLIKKTAEKHGLQRSLNVRYIGVETMPDVLMARELTAAPVTTVRPAGDGSRGDANYRKQMSRLRDLLESASIQAGQIDTQAMKLEGGDPFVSHGPLDAEDEKAVREMREGWKKIGDWAIGVSNDINKIFEDANRR